MGFKKDNFDFQTEEEKISRINSAGLINITIENAWKECYKAMVSADLVRWNRTLDTVWAILGGDVKEGDEDDIALRDLDMKIYDTGSLNHRKSGFQVTSDDERQKIALQYLRLKKKTLFLRRLQNKQGKGTAYKDDDADDFD